MDNQSNGSTSHSANPTYLFRQSVLTILLKESIRAFDAFSLSGFRLADAFLSPDDSSSPEEENPCQKRYIIDNQQNGLETQAKVSMLLTRHP